jgi:aryl sulfotransferase
MATHQDRWPVKTREIHDLFFDSRAWNDFAFRDDDIIIGTWGKSGTTWMQQIIGQLVFDGQEDLPVSEMSPWLDMVVPPLAPMMQGLAAQTHRRFIKTHLPVDALVFSPEAKYLYVGRDGRDVVWSMHHHQINFTAEAFEAFNTNPRRGPGAPLKPPTADVGQYFRDWLEKDGYPWWPFWENIRSWWAIRDLPNVMLVHFAQLKADLPGEMRRIAAFLNIPIDEDRWPVLVEHSTFDYMKAHAQHSAPLGGAFWEGGATTFINKGTNGRWRDVLPAAEIGAYERRAREALGDACAHWLATGEMAT